jgi:hypothetical protein
MSTEQFARGTGHTSIQSCSEKLQDRVPSASPKAKMDRVEPGRLIASDEYSNCR